MPDQPNEANNSNNPSTPLSAQSNADPVVHAFSNPPAPTGIAAVGGNYQVTVTWNPNVGDGELAGYMLFRDPSESPIYTGPTASYVDHSAVNGTAYTYHVIAYDGGGAESLSWDGTATAAPVAPTVEQSGTITHAINNTLAPADSPGGFTGDWWAIYHTDDSTFVASQSTPNSWVVTRPSTGVLSVVVPMAATINNFYRVYTQDPSTGSTPESLDFGVTVYIPPPPTPTGFAVVAGNEKNTISWNAVTGVSGLAGYRVFRNSSQVYQGTALSFVDTGLTDGTAASYTLCSYLSGGLQSALTSVISATPVGTLVPQGHTVTDTASGILGPSDSPGGTSATTWEIYKNTTLVASSASAASWTVVRSGGSNIAITAPASATLGTDYKAYTIASDSTNPLSLAFQVVLPPPPVAPAGLTGIAWNASTYLSWNTTPYATSYHLKRATGESGSFAVIASPSGTTYTDSTALNGVAYFYEVCGVNTGGEGAPSSAITLTPQNADFPLYMFTGDSGWSPAPLLIDVGANDTTTGYSYTVPSNSSTSVYGQYNLGSSRRKIAKIQVTGGGIASPNATLTVWCSESSTGAYGAGAYSATFSPSGAFSHEFDLTATAAQYWFVQYAGTNSTGSTISLTDFRIFDSNGYPIIAGDSTPPVLVSAATDHTGAYIYAVFAEIQNPPVSASSTAGFSVLSDLSPIGVASAVRQSDGLTYKLTLASTLSCVNDIRVSYSSSTGTLADSAPVPNAVRSFSNVPVSNLIDDNVAPVLLRSATSSDGTQVIALFLEKNSPPLTPAVPTGFTLKVNGTSVSFSVQRRGFFGDDAVTYVFGLSTPIVPTDVVTLSYSSSTGNVTDSFTTPNAMATFSNQSVVNAVVSVGSFFDPSAWVQGGFATSVPLGDLWERRVGFPTATAILDQTPPSGDVILNESLDTGGIELHYFAIVGPSGTITGFEVTEDPLGVTVAEAAELGGETDPSEYETIGQGSKRAFSCYLPLGTDGLYPLVTEIHVGATADREKGYRVEAKTVDFNGVSSDWTPVYYIIASDETREFFKYTFTVTGGVRLSAVRILYRGDFFAATESGTVTVSGQDALTDITAIQLSHFSDFRDVMDFSLADNNGWVPFDEGVSIYNWNLLASGRFWDGFTSAAGAAIQNFVVFNDQFIAYTTSGIFQQQADNSLLQVYTASSGVHIQAIHVYQGKVFAGLSNGVLLSSPTGSLFTAVNGSTPIEPITALGHYGGRLWIGTSPTSGSGTVKLNVFDGKTITQMHTLPYLYVNALAVAQGRLYVALGGASGSNAGDVYEYDGASWTLRYTGTSDQCQALVLTTADSRLWAAMQGGKIYALSFDSNNKPKTWAKVWDGQAGDYYALTDDPAGLLVWITASTGVTAYLASTGQFISLPAPMGYTYGLNALFTNSDTGHVQQVTVDVGDGNTSFVDTGVNWPDLHTTRPNGINSGLFNARWTGYVRADYTEDYIFSMLTADGCRVTIGGNLLIDEWHAAQGLEYTGSIVLQAGEWYSLTVDYFANANTSGSIAEAVLSWESDSLPKSVIPFHRLATVMPPSNATTLRTIGYKDGIAYGAGADGVFYDYAGGPIGTNLRTVYLRLKDGAGNETAPSAAITDTILRGQPPSSGGSGGTPSDPEEVFHSNDGRIYQVTTDSSKSLLATFESVAPGPVYAPDRTIHQTAIYESEPFYAATLTHWSSLALVTYLAVAPSATAGLDSGVQVDAYVRTGITRDDCLAATWVGPTTITNIGAPSVSGVVSGSMSLTTLPGKWLQYRLVLTSASRGIKPVVQLVTLSYQSANASYFFSAMFDMADYATAPTVPQVRRFLLTSNTVENGGQVLFGYTTDSSSGSTFDYSQYTQIIPNQVTELPEPSETLRFGVLLVSLSSGNPALLDDYAVQLDLGPYDVRVMQAFPAAPAP